MIVHQVGTPNVPGYSVPMQPRPITETPNELTTDIDVASPVQIVRMLRGSDAQLYSGYRGFPATSDQGTIEQVAQAVGWAAEAMGRPDAAIIIAGAGTSGRLAMFVARAFNRLLVQKGRSANLNYLIAGGDLALIKAQEGAEDNPHQAVTDIEPLIAGKKDILYIGVTCAFAAPYVASQLNHLSSSPAARCILLGFNPVDRARRLPIEGWDRSFADVIGQLTANPRCMVLNPVVGPEPITGSTRMKGGSATKMIVETILGLAARTAGILPPLAADDRPAAIAQCLRAYEHARLTAYAREEALAELVALGGQALRSGRHIYYLGAGEPGILGIIDASECPPTYGADFEDVRGFITGGWTTLLGPDRDLSEKGGPYRIGSENFLKDQLPQLAGDDLVVVLAGAGSPQRLLKAAASARERGARTAWIIAGKPIPTSARGVASQFDVVLELADLPRSPLPTAHLYAELALKLVINALTTGAHVLAGKVFQNRMIDLRISNNKLYYRAIGIIQDLMSVDPEQAKRCLLRSIYLTDVLTPAQVDAPVSEHIRAATMVPKVMPVALVLAGKNVPIVQAQAILRNEPVVRSAIHKLRDNSR